jgi:mitotic spindle assembly checkpoint protein MAD1
MQPFLHRAKASSQDLPSRMEFWIQKEQCILGFMASVELECYVYAKMQGGGV